VTSGGIVKFAAFSLFILMTGWLHAQTLPRVTVIHTSDLHSHFTARQSDRGLGGYARLKSKITQLRGERPNALLLDAGDWSEGTIFFTLGSGVQTEKIMDKFGYDAMVLGNHDWLVGPNQMYETFLNSGLKTPVLSANLNFSDLSPQVPLRNFIKPYIVKEVGGVKVGIFGLSTFQLIFDHYFSPVKITDPVRPAIEMVNYLRRFEKCQIVIALTHLGFAQDKIIAETVSGIDLIVGGHDHSLFKKPKYVNGVPIVHIGSWGEYIGDYQLELQPDGKTKLVSHIVHQIDNSIKDDAEIAGMVNESIDAIDKKFETAAFSDSIAFSDVDLNVSHRALANDLMAQWSVDAMRTAAQAEIAVDSPLFASSQIKRGFIHTSDVFDLFPHIYVDRNHKAWTIHTYEVSGYTLRALLSLLVKFKLPLNLSNAQIVVDMKSKDPIESILIGGQKLNLFRKYLIASNPGVLELFKRLKSLGVPIGPKVWTDTGLEVWRVVKVDLVRRSPIHAKDLPFEPRVRTVAPDFMVGNEYLRFEETASSVRVYFKVFNAGLTAAALPETKIRVDKTPLNALDDNWAEYRPSARGQKATLAPGESVEMYLEWPMGHALAGASLYPVEITVGSAPGEQNLTNNSMVSHLKVVTLID